MLRKIFFFLGFFGLIGSLFAQCADVVVPEATEEAIRYYRGGNALWAFEQIWGWLILVMLLVTGWSGKLGSFAKKRGKVWFFSIALYLILFTVIYQLLFFPYDYYVGYVRQHAYGLSTQTLERWLTNDLIGVLVLIGTSIAFVWIVYLLLKKSPHRWWFYSSIASVFVSFIIMFVQPIWIDPLYNNFGPMNNKQLEQKILALAARAKIDDGRVYEVNKSQDTNTINAYVTGFGSSNRIVLWDTAIQQLTEEEVLFVMGHEMGHYVLHHVWWQLLYFGALSFLIFYLTYRSANYLMHRYSHRFGFTKLYQIASLPLLLLLTSVFMFLAQPLSNFVSRALEHNADTFGLEITQNNRAAGESFLVLQQTNLAVPRPGPLVKFWRSTHPPLGERVDFFNRYCPWTEGKPLKYGNFFTEKVEN